MDADGALDALDWGLVEQLQADGRMSWSELGRRVGLSAPAVADRVRRLEETGVITGYRAVVDPTRLGLSLRALVTMKPADTRQWHLLAEFAQGLPEVLRCHHVTGRECYVLEVAVADVAHLHELLGSLQSHGETTTSVVLHTPVEHRVQMRRSPVRRASRPALDSPPDGHGARHGLRAAAPPAASS